MANDPLPTDIQWALERIKWGGGSTEDRVLLRDYLVAHGNELDYQTATMIGAALGQAGGGGNLPEVILPKGQQPAVNTVTSQGQPVDVDAMMGGGHTTGGTMGGNTDWTQQPEISGLHTPLRANTSNPMAVSPALQDTGGALDPRLVARAANQRQRRAQTDLLNAPPDVNWEKQASDIRGVPPRTIPGESAFAGVDPGYMAGLNASPQLAAEMMAKQRNQGKPAPNAADVLAPQLEAALGLEQAGILGGGRGLGGYTDPGDELLAAENFVNQLGPGQYVPSYDVYQRAFRNVRKTDPNEMWTEGAPGNKGDLTQVIATTNGALVAANPYMTKESADALSATLAQAQDEYLMGVASGDIDPDVTSYPEWLRTEKHARRWVGPGLTMEQARSAL